MMLEVRQLRRSCSREEIDRSASNGRRFSREVRTAFSALGLYPNEQRKHTWLLVR